MSSIDNEIISISQQIVREKLIIEAAISRGVVFEEVKKFVLCLRDLEKKLDHCVSRQMQETRNPDLMRSSGALN